MNRFAALDSDNEEETQQKKVAEKKVVKKTETAQPAAATAAAAAPKKTESKPKTDSKNEKSDKPRPKKERAPKTESAPAESSGAEVVDASKESQPRKKNFNKAPKTRYEKKQDDPSNPMIKPDNRIRGGAHANQHRHPSKHSKDAAEHTAKDAEKHPEAELAEGDVVVEEVEKIEEPVVEEEPEPPKLGLDDFLRQRDEARANSAILNEVKTARVVNDLSGLKIKGGDDLPSVYVGSGKQSKASKDATQRSKVKTVFSDLGFSAEVAPVVTEDRRTQQRGNGRNNKDQKARGPRVDLSDASAFPSL